MAAKKVEYTEKAGSAAFIQTSVQGEKKKCWYVSNYPGKVLSHALLQNLLTCCISKTQLVMFELILENYGLLYDHKWGGMWW